MKRIRIGVLAGLGILLLVELIGRHYGLTTYPLYDASAEFEYVLKPNQRVTIYRNRFETNTFSMRSKPVSSGDSTVVLLLGDSVVNGGNAVDQDSLASSLLEEELFLKYGKKIRVLNISDKTWSPDNVVAYLKKFGLFQADMLLLVANSGDAFDPMTFRPVVGVAPTHPAENHLFAWQSLWDKMAPMLMEKIAVKPEIVPLVEKKEPFVKGFSDLDSLAHRLQIPLSLYLHRTQSELRAHTLDEGGVAIVDFCKRKQIPFTINTFQSDFFIDDIHLNHKGQRALAKDLLPIICQGLKL
ncbi:hypothetical protein ACFPMF_24680 [Larkinella bovis]|uniref:SGNH/GDSL hydrolase family protein n=1 Tax=Larkinella bovis TaxID=683041 RepID=A0ABW0IGC4_9BACT